VTLHAIYAWGGQCLGGVGKTIATCARLVKTEDKKREVVVLVLTTDDDPERFTYRKFRILGGNARSAVEIFWQPPPGPLGWRRLPSRFDKTTPRATERGSEVASDLPGRSRLRAAKALEVRTRPADQAGATAKVFYRAYASMQIIKRLKMQSRTVRVIGRVGAAFLRKVYRKIFPRENLKKSFYLKF